MDVVADLLSPSGNEAFDDILTDFMRVVARPSMGAYLLPCDNRTRWLLLVIVQWVE